MNKYTLITVLILLLSCKSETESVNPSQDVNSVNENKSVQNVNWALKSSSEFTENWAEIIAFEDELKRVLTSEIQTEKDIELLKKIMGDVKSTCPERFKVPAIQARIKVLETEILMLEQELKDGVLTDVSNKKQHIQTAYNVFIGQIEALIYKERDYEKYN